jgi:hypothetical protein
MLDGLTVDQLRTFVAAADAGSFSAAGRSLGRAQSVVSQGGWRTWGEARVPPCCARVGQHASQSRRARYRKR